MSEAVFCKALDNWATFKLAYIEEEQGKNRVIKMRNWTLGIVSLIIIIFTTIVTILETLTGLWTSELYYTVIFFFLGALFLYLGLLYIKAFWDEGPLYRCGAITAYLVAVLCLLARSIFDLLLIFSFLDSCKLSDIGLYKAIYIPILFITEIIPILCYFALAMLKKETVSFRFRHTMLTDVEGARGVQASQRN